MHDRHDQDGRLEIVMVILMTDDAPAHDGAVGDSIGIMRLVCLFVC